MTTNPSHILIARNSRGLNNPSASLSSPTETHAAASGVFRSSGSPPWLYEEYETDEIESELSADEDEGAVPIEIHETFTKNCRFPGTVKIVVESTTFWAHKEILYFASPFFEAALSGNWAETGRPTSMSSIATISQSRLRKGGSIPRRTSVGISTDPDNDTSSAADTSSEFDEMDVIPEFDSSKNDSEQRDQDISESEKARQREDSLWSLQGSGKSRSLRTTSSSSSTQARIDSASRSITGAQAIVHCNPRNGPEAEIVLKEEKASIFHDFLKYSYPQMECTITWNNVAGLMNISHKFSVPSLQSECLTFLLTHAAGKPLKAMRIAEIFQEEELYREASRFVLDNPGDMNNPEMNILSKETLLKLEKRRSWFLERVLKLGITMVAKEYQCCPTCPDSAVCAKLLEEKWRQAYNAVNRFGNPQPSMAFRYLRMLEGINPPLALTHTACQASAKAFVATLFDRMFSLGVRGAGTDAVPLGGRVAVAAASATVNGPRRHFLYCTLKQEPSQGHKKGKSRDLL
ncbi:hypothetical protein JR316_0002257 [Psilocybe cubensis]|uniref:BTB domain-containing protein n=2 Tax=Psilocybe cubensis TaxID=181762 RepID=A0A8H7Y379_PSICU|nr:hypothetical protein JR316_0002257 [Psilocybe cubensis]KAH9485349.1 hypothetical protein JR316_0002257 [Psilocybe cubensis]